MEKIHWPILLWKTINNADTGSIVELGKKIAKENSESKKPEI